MVRSLILSLTLGVITISHVAGVIGTKSFLAAKPSSDECSPGTLESLDNGSDIMTAVANLNRLSWRDDFYFHGENEAENRSHPKPHLTALVDFIRTLSTADTPKGVIWLLGDAFDNKEWMRSAEIYPDVVAQNGGRCRNEEAKILLDWVEETAKTIATLHSLAAEDDGTIIMNKALDGVDFLDILLSEAYAAKPIRDGGLLNDIEKTDEGEGEINLFDAKAENSSDPAEVQVEDKEHSALYKLLESMVGKANQLKTRSPLVSDLQSLLKVLKGIATSEVPTRFRLADGPGLPKLK